MSVRVDAGSTLLAAQPMLVFEAAFDAGRTLGLPDHAVAPGGQHVYFLRGSNWTVRPTRIQVVSTWLDEFKQRANGIR